MEEIRELAERNSVLQEKVRVLRKRTRKSEKSYKNAVAIIILLSTITALQLGYDIKDRRDNNKAVNAYFAEVDDKVKDEWHPTANYKSIYYDLGDLIEYIKEVPDEIPERLYGVTSHIGFNKSWTVDDLDSIVIGVYKNEDGTSVYESFDDFLIKNEFVDKDGKPSTKEYSDRIIDYMREKVEYTEKLDSIGGKGLK